MVGLTMLEALSLLYAMNIFICLVSYLPQCWSLKTQISTDQVDLSTNLYTWALWTYCNIVTLAYSIFCTDHWEFQLVASANAALSLLTLMLTFAVHRRFYQLQQKNL